MTDRNVDSTCEIVPGFVRIKDLYFLMSSGGMDRSDEGRNELEVTMLMFRAEESS